MSEQKTTLLDAAEDVVLEGRPVGDFTTLSDLQGQVLVPASVFAALKAAVEAANG